MKRTLLSIFLLTFCFTSLNAGEPEDLVIVSTKAFLNACRLTDNGYGYKAILKKSKAETPELKNLLADMSLCQAAYENNQSDSSPRKPEEILEDLRLQSLAQTLWGDVLIIEGNKYLAVTRTVPSLGSSLPIGGWGCLDYEGNVVIPLTFNYILDGNTDLDAIVFAADMGDSRMPGATRRLGVMKNDGTVALNPKYDEVLFLFDKWIAVHERNNRINGYSIFDKNYKLILTGIADINDIVYNFKDTDCQKKFFVITNEKRLKALFTDDLQQITDFVFSTWEDHNPYWKGYSFTDGKESMIDIRDWKRK